MACSVIDTCTWDGAGCPSLRSLAEAMGQRLAAGPARRILPTWGEIHCPRTERVVLARWDEAGRLVSLAPPEASRQSAPVSNPKGRWN